MVTVSQCQGHGPAWQGTAQAGGGAARPWLAALARVRHEAWSSSLTGMSPKFGCALAVVAATNPGQCP